MKGVALLPALVLGVAGCHHNPAQVSYQPPPLAQPGEDGSARPAVPRGAAPDIEAGVPHAGSDLEPQGKTVSSEVGLASWYGPGFTGRKVADGTMFDPNGMTAAHRELPLGTIVRVTNLTNNQQVLLRINDHGPFIEGRILDLTPAAAKAIDMYRAGIAKVRVEAWPPPIGSDPVGKWCVQIGAFHDPDDALQLKNDLKQRYPSARVAEFASSTGHWVRIDPKNDTRDMVNQIVDTIHIPDPGAQPYIVRLN
jgi:rare lipoprotein A